MQPCGICGGTAVDANGFCTGCRAYRGLPEPEPEPTSVYPTTYELIDPSIGAPYSDPTAPPHSSYQAKYQADYQAEYQQPAPTRRRSPLVVPLVALSATLLVAIVAIVVVAVVRS